MMLKVLSFVTFSIIAVTDVLSNSDQKLQVIDDYNNQLKATVNTVPYQVSIQLLGVHYCSGVIIDKQWVLTTAKCIAFTNEMTYPLVLIRAGSVHRYEGGSIHSIRRVYRHPFFNFNEKIPLPNDLALIEVTEKFRFDSSRQPISYNRTLSYSNQSYEGVVSGWNDNQPSHDNEGWEVCFNENLVSHNATIFSEQQCKEYFFQFLGDVTVDKICAFSNDACDAGDLGNPLVVDGNLVGIKAWKMGCNFNNTPSLYTNVSQHIDWIDATIDFEPFPMSTTTTRPTPAYNTWYWNGFNGKK